MEIAIALRQLLPLLALVLVWTALQGSRRQVVACLAGIVVALGAPIAVVGAPLYPASGLLGAAGWLTLAAVASIYGQSRVAGMRRHAGAFASLVGAAQEAFVCIDLEGRVIEWSEHAEALFGRPRDTAVGEELAGLIAPVDEADELRVRLQPAVAVEGAPPASDGQRAEATALHRSGRRFPVEITLAPSRDEGRRVLNVFFRDVTEQKQAEEALDEAEERFRRAFSDSAIGMAIASPEGRWIAFNTALGELTGYPSEKLLGMRFGQITHPEDSRDDPELFGELVSGKRDVLQTERRFIHADGHPLWVGLTVSAIRDEHGRTLYLVAQMQDITERRGAAARLEHQALHDPLTGLPNRTLFDDRAQLARERLRRGGEPFAVMFVDLDRFKQVNDSRGHEFGDRVLVAAGRRLVGLLRGTDTAARFGGDEFTLLCEGVDEPGARHIGGRIVEAFAEPFGDAGDEVHLTVSVGMCVVKDPGDDLKRVMRHADAAMYAAKSHGRARWALYRPEPAAAEASPAATGSGTATRSKAKA
jgi:diguanylate cyclase (GGDEF)-like protein/PAS domain S-box-containing protein